MKFGVRECCDVVFRAKSTQKIGNKIFYKHEPVIYFDTLKTSSLEGSATTVYAQGGRGNSRLMSWDGERTVTFTMEDALISPEGISILTGAGLVSAEETPVIQHLTERTDKIDAQGNIYVQEKPHDFDPTPDPATAKENSIYVMKLDTNGEINSEPFIYQYDGGDPVTTAGYEGLYKLTIRDDYDDDTASGYEVETGTTAPKANDIVLVDYYTEHTSGAFEIDITPDKFGGAFYIEGSTLFRDQATQKDMPAEIIIPSGRIQSNFTFTMASSGDPSSFTFTIDAFPDYTRYDKTKKVIAAIQVIAEQDADKELARLNTKSLDDVDGNGEVYRP